MSRVSPGFLFVLLAYSLKGYDTFVNTLRLYSSLLNFEKNEN